MGGTPGSDGRDASSSTDAEESSANDSGPRKAGWTRRRLLFLGLSVVFVLLAVATARLFIWPGLAPLPARVDAIVELGGRGGRDDKALALARAGRAPYLVQSTVVAEAGTHRCLPPVANVTVLCFHAEPNTTRGEAREIAKMAEQYGWHSVILVTSPDQAWRARLRVQRCFPGKVYVATTPLPFWLWFKQIPYQWAASARAVLLERDC
jgi:uncharacterized SAM-binding protein YcdF (DUF218 family)